MSVSTFDELSLEGLKDIYDAEHQITEALPRWPMPLPPPN